MKAVSENPRIAFFGNHDVGLHALEGLLGVTPNVCVIAHPLDPEDGLVYKSVGGFAEKKGLAWQRGRASDDLIFEFVKDFSPDVIWCTDYRYLLPKRLIDLTPDKAINLHPSLLPKYRGRAPLNWAIINGETQTGLTAHLIDEGMDTGDIIQQEHLEIGSNDSVRDVLEKLYPLYKELSTHVLSNLIEGKIRTKKQIHNNATVFPKRTPKDGELDWTWSAERIHNFIRALAAPYPGAFSQLTKQSGDVIGTCTFWQSELLDRETKPGSIPGEVISIKDGKLVVKSGDGHIKILNWTCNTDTTSPPEQGYRFGRSSGNEN